MLEKSESFTKVKSVLKRYQNEVLAAVTLLLVILLIAVRYDFYYDLNDDVMIKDILSGVYAGVPKGHNIQMLYPLSLVLSLVYRLIPAFPVYGFFLLCCQFGCFFLLTRRCIQFRRSLASKLFIACFSAVMMLSLFLEHFVFVQYTMTSALLTATAAFLFLTGVTKQEERFFKKNAVSLLLCAVAFMLRSEMFLLLLPMIGIAGLIKWSWEKEILNKNTIIKYLSFAGGIIVSVLLSLAVNELAYSSADWSKFMDFFDRRTELYDYQWYPEYESNQDFYASIGLSQADQKMLIQDYNFGMEERLGSATLKAIANRSKSIRAASDTVQNYVKKAVQEYLYRNANKTAEDYPWNLLIIMGYLSVLMGMIWHGSLKGKKTGGMVISIAWKLMLLGIVRTGLWLFILYRGRTPARITHGLYMMEFWILLAMLVMVCNGIEAKLYRSVKATLVFPLMMCIVLVTSLIPKIAAADQEYAKREEINRTDRLFREYCKENASDFFWLDVYSSVDYSQKLLEEPGPGIQNFDLMGGWVCKSPLYYEKQAYFGLGTMEEELIGNSKVFLAADLLRGTDWLTDYYRQRGKEVEPVLVEVIDNRLGIYHLELVSQ